MLEVATEHQLQQTTGAPYKAQLTYRENEQAARDFLGTPAQPCEANGVATSLETELGISFPQIQYLRMTGLASGGELARGKRGTPAAAAASISKKQKQVNTSNEVVEQSELTYSGLPDAEKEMPVYPVMRAEEEAYPAAASKLFAAPVAPAPALLPIPQPALLPVAVVPGAAANSAYFRSSGWPDPADLRSGPALRKELARRIDYVPSKSSVDDLRARYETEYRNRHRRYRRRPNTAEAKIRRSQSGYCRVSLKDHEGRLLIEEEVKSRQGRRALRRLIERCRVAVRSDCQVLVSFPFGKEIYQDETKDCHLNLQHISS